MFKNGKKLNKKNFNGNNSNKDQPVWDTHQKSVWKSQGNCIRSTGLCCLSKNTFCFSAKKATSVFQVERWLVWRVVEDFKVRAQREPPSVGSLMALVLRVALISPPMSCKDCCFRLVVGQIWQVDPLLLFFHFDMDGFFYPFLSVIHVSNKLKKNMQCRHWPRMSETTACTSWTAMYKVGKTRTFTLRCTENTPTRSDLHHPLEQTSHSQKKTKKNNTGCEKERERKRKNIVHMWPRSVRNSVEEAKPSLNRGRDPRHHPASINHQLVWFNFPERSRQRKISVGIFLTAGKAIKGQPFRGLFTGQYLNDTCFMTTETTHTPKLNTNTDICSEPTTDKLRHMSFNQQTLWFPVTVYSGTVTQHQGVLLVFCSSCLVVTSVTQGRPKEQKQPTYLPEFAHMKWNVWGSKTQTERKRESRPKKIEWRRERKGGEGEKRLGFPLHSPCCSLIKLMTQAQGMIHTCTHTTTFTYTKK